MLGRQKDLCPGSDLWTLTMWKPQQAVCGNGKFALNFQRLEAYLLFISEWEACAVGFGDNFKWQTSSQSTGTL